METTKTLNLVRYSNRKLYNLDTSKYTTLKEIGENVKQGFSVKVIDKNTGKDLSKRTELLALASLEG